LTLLGGAQSKQNNHPKTADFTNPKPSPPKRRSNRASAESEKSKVVVVVAADLKTGLGLLMRISECTY
jgi:hypothetical protein